MYFRGSKTSAAPKIGHNRALNRTVRTEITAFGGKTQDFEVTKTGSPDCVGILH